MSETLILALNMMWQGMLGIIVVMAILALVVSGLTKVGDFCKK